ncbi:hypothetical protein BGW36DRAFT_396974 [Talaromyces proteolyticus]|uniref:3-oxo-5-alpha-steroid 4-dehydrogenase C-terminal domain-containing protein n=1 Tax=Talaromyces proteolyticus TaxID=1131652 RepID=A0AAD4KR44_9EURO|nr:uncharacterized protein BGW36DRAFT_396974 [Talaromyces proteolyticus]KAH8697183.1 hypothetical protein BGW36DRAFT_396974 [Talaromyces proteolyticus]
MTSIFDIVKSFFPPTPWAYSWQLGIFQWFPAATVLQWLVRYHPAGKFSLHNSVLNVNGRFAWCVMELVGPVQLLYILATFPAEFKIAELPFWNKVTAALYVIHYINRSIVNPLFVAPSISPARIELFLFACLFNWFNSACISGWIVGYDTQLAGYESNGALSIDLLESPWKKAIPWVGLSLFAYGLINNISAERTLWSLRREEALRRAAKKSDDTDKDVSEAGNQNIYHKVYVIPPPSGLFRWILYPHYAFEWLEWIGFALVGISVYPARSMGLFQEETLSTPAITLAPWIRPFASLANRLQIPLPLPALVFVLNDIFTMMPQARRGREWYSQKFGKDAVAGRSAAIPGVAFL